MAPTRSPKRSTILDSCRTKSSNHKNEETSPPLYKNGLLNASLPARSELMAIAKRNSTNSPLLKLPGEIRNKIWMFAQGYHRIDIGKRSRKRSWPIGLTLAIYPMNAATHFPRTFVKPTFALSRVCRQIYVEASSYIYTLNTFGFDGFASFDRWAKDRALGQARLITSINMPYDYTHLYRRGFRTSFRRKFPNIKRIGVDEHVAFFSRTSPDDTIEMAEQRIVDLIKLKEGADILVDWHYGVGAVMVHY
ncbi:hypothetical protein BDU57DRAFT_95101 [Ampelomyces quisqualis]|uniref:DUF7730 domain-containing protein n=1 Tax=Ampelomyces quisqualis TaxID=50730 RepID=A0A6A5Q9R3_AMPQU|nr:hypothetical protein BDU57DRAFT_95101 [Ampelomyces quisqualis]